MRIVSILILLCSLSTTVVGQGAPWLTYHVYPGELALHSDTPKVAVFADGRVRIARFAWQPQPGLYEYILEPAELDALVAAATAPELAAVDLAVAEQALAEARRRLARDQQRFFAIADADRYHVTVASGAAPRSRTPNAGRIELVWEMVHPALEEAAGIPARDRLAVLREMLESLATVDDVRRIADAPSPRDPSQ
jgi:hypothetical protein